MSCNTPAIESWTTNESDQSPANESNATLVTTQPDSLDVSFIARQPKNSVTKKEPTVLKLYTQTRGSRPRNTNENTTRLQKSSPSAHFKCRLSIEKLVFWTSTPRKIYNLHTYIHM